MTGGAVHAIYIVAGRGRPLLAVPEVLAVAGKGLEGDRYFLGKGSLSRWPGPGRQVTLIEHEALEAVRDEHGLDLGGGLARRNIVTRGVELGDRKGQRFRIGTALFRAVQPCQPCGYLERKTQAGAFAALKGRGGLRAEVPEGGVIRVGEAVEFL
ncbi:MAG TPA: MOSC domain-containing protein [Gemmataceae bacterium]|nr:MOSC domain-containing protein [Gemmataceae bacterium]